MTKLKPVEYDVDVSEYTNSSERPLYKPVTVHWNDPKSLAKDGKIVFEDSDQPVGGCLYAIVRNDRRNSQSDRVLYIGITNDLRVRFREHWKVNEIRAEQGLTSLSIGAVDFGSYRTASGKGNRRAIEELEHIFIWTVWHDLWNDKKQVTLPGLGKFPGRAWDITNTGFKFSGRMPQRIVYPCIAAEARKINR